MSGFDSTRIGNQLTEPSSVGAGGLHFEDNENLSLGNTDAAPDYWLTYNSSGTQLELQGTNVDGAGADGVIFKVEDGTDDVNFTGTITSAGFALDAGLITFTTGTAITNTLYQFGRDNATPNRMQANIPTGTSFSWSVNGIEAMNMNVTRLNLYDIANLNSAVNSRIEFTTTTGLLLSRNVADAAVAVTLQNKHASSTGNIVEVKNDIATTLTIAQDGGLTLAPEAQTSGVPDTLTITGAAHTGLTAATEDVGIYFNLAATKTWAAGAGPLATQREIRFAAPTYNGDAGGALTITDAATVYISGAPVQGTNITLSNPHALWVDAGNVRFDGTLNSTGGGALTGTWSDLGSVTTVDINGGTLDGVTIGGAVAGAITGTTITATSIVIGANTITTAEWANLDGLNQTVATTSSPTFVNLTITSFAANWTNAGRTVADLGIVTTVDINGGTIDGATIGGAAAGAGTFTALVGTSLDLNGALDLDVAALGATITNTADAASSQVMILEGDRASFADNDEIYLSWRLSNDAGMQIEYARFTVVATDVNVATDEDGRLDFAVRTADVLANELSLTGAGLYPSTGDGLSLGISGTAFSDIYLASGAIVDFASADVTWTHSAGQIAFSGDFVGNNANSGRFAGDAVASGTVPTYNPNRTDTDSGLGAAGADQLSLIAGGVEIMRLTEALTGATAVTIAQQANTSGAPTALLITGGAHTAITAATESNGINFDFSATKTWAAGAGPLARQGEIIIKAPTYNGDVAGALTITNAYTLYIDGAPIQGTNITLSNRFALGLGAGMIAAGDIVVSNANGSAMFNAAASGTVPTLSPDRSDSDTGIGTAGADILSLIAGAVEVGRFTEAGASGNTFTLAGGTLTSGGTSDETLDITATLNDAGAAGGSDVFTMLRANLTVTDATGWDNVYLFDFQVGGSSRILYDRTNTQLQLGSSAATQINIQAEDQGAGNNTAGRPLLISAGKAGTSTTGADGGNLFLAAGNAGGTGNNGGGNINLTPGDNTGSGQDGAVNINQPGGVAGTDAIGMAHNGTDAIFINLDTTGDLTFGIGAGNTSFSVSAESVIMANDILIRRDVNAGLTASTTQTQGQGPLTAEINEVATVANVNDTVTLPTAVAGLKIVIINNGANTLRIFPASGDNLGAGVDTATTLAAGSNVVYVAYNVTNWESI